MSAAGITRNYLQFEEQRQGWIGRYAQATTRRLNEDCPICLDRFQPTDQVIVLPCSHPFHDKCFTPWTKQTCPFDGTPVEGTKKASLLGQTILFPPKTQAIGTWLYTNRELINQWLRSTLEQLPPEKLEKELEDAKLVIPVLQGILNAYEGAVIGNLLIQDAREKAGLLISSLFQEEDFIKKLLQEDPAGIKELLQGYTADKCKHALNNLIFFAQFLFDVIPPIDPESLTRSVTYMHSVVSVAINHPNYNQLALEADRQFHLKHFKAIRLQPTKAEKDRYLRQQDESTLSRLKKLTADSGSPTSRYIQTQIEKIEQARLCCQKFKKSIITGALIILPLAWGWCAINAYRMK